MNPEKAKKTSGTNENIRESRKTADIIPFPSQQESGIVVDAEIKPLSVETQIAVMNMENVSDEAPWTEQVTGALKELGFKCQSMSDENRMRILWDRDRMSLILTQSEAQELLREAVRIWDEEEWIGKDVHASQAMNPYHLPVDVRKERQQAFNEYLAGLAHESTEEQK